MSQAIGWWDYDETDRPTLVNRLSGERVRLGGEVDIPGKQPGQSWVRIDYLHDDLEFPVLACWEPRRGHVVVDYLASAELWRRETNSDRLYPPYGTWVRVDDCLMDAIWCWPGNIFWLGTRQSPWRFHTSTGAGFIGGWSNGAWRPELLRLTTAPMDLDARINQADNYEAALRLSLRQVISPDAASPAPWHFIGVPGKAEAEQAGYNSFGDVELVPDSDLSRFEGTGEFDLPPGPAGVALDGVVPHMRAKDGSCVLFPIRVGLDFGHRATRPTGGTISFVCLEPGLYGIKGAWARGRGSSALSFTGTEIDEVEVYYQDAYVSPHHPVASHPSSARPRHGDHRKRSRKRKKRRKKRAAQSSRFSGIADFGQEVVDRLKLDAQEVHREYDYGYRHMPTAWILSAEARRRVTRLLQDAMLFWHGTDARPPAWDSVEPRLLSYRRPESVTINSHLLAGYLWGFDITARLGDDRPWTREGFRFAPFLGGGEEGRRWLSRLRRLLKPGAARIIK